MATVAISDLTIEYSSGGYAVRPIADLNLDIDDGELVLLLGASGCGKTTLLSALASLLKPAAGTIRVGDTLVTSLNGRELTSYRRRGVGVVFQAFNLIPSMNAVDNVALPLWASKTPAREARRRAATALERVGLGDRLRHRPDQLSGGQAQRVAIARALVHEPPLILADEPTAHLDYIQVESVLALLRELRGPGHVIVIATHDERLLPIADRVIELTPRAEIDTAPLEVIDLADGEVLFRQGDRGSRVYLVDRGAIELRRELVAGGYEVVATAAPGSYFGELAPMFGLPRAATAVAMGPTVVASHPLASFREHVRN
ncbi:MAG: putative transport system ATP-binding protein [Acidimicrobiaceae bacterium]|jgi:putative ABC transport system ATP-binding protein